MRERSAIPLPFSMTDPLGYDEFSGLHLPLTSWMSGSDNKLAAVGTDIFQLHALQQHAAF